MDTRYGDPKNVKTENKLYHGASTRTLFDVLQPVAQCWYAIFRDLSRSIILLLLVAMLNLSVAQQQQQQQSFRLQHLHENTTTQDSPLSAKVAVCISGQLARLNPKQLLEGQILPNPTIDHYLFFNIQKKANVSEAVFSSMAGKGPGRSKYALHMPTDEIILQLDQLLTTKSSKIIRVIFSPPKNREEWEIYILKELGALDRITQYEREQQNILNMYNHHVQCAEQIKDFEVKSGFHFDYIVSTREDAFWFTPINMTYLIQTHFLQGKCQILSKNCLAWAGINMRYQIFTRDAGLQILESRISFYQSLFTANQFYFNPESFELGQVHHFNLTHCPLPITDIPVTAVRFVDDVSEKMCFIAPEINDCNFKNEWHTNSPCWCAPKEWEGPRFPSGLGFC